LTKNVFKLSSQDLDKNVGIISSDFVDGTFARSVIKQNYVNPNNVPDAAEEMQCNGNWGEWGTPVPETCADLWKPGCGGKRERSRQCTQCSSNSCGFERPKTSCTVFEVEELACDTPGKKYYL